MKKVLLPMKEGETAWVVTHRLSLASERNFRIRPIHIWTFLGAHSARRADTGMSRLFMALENKLYGVRLARLRLRQALSYTADAFYSHGNVQDYDGEHQALFDLESFLNAVYSALEIASMINKRQDPKLPRGFRSQGKKGKYGLFELRRWSWLPLFFDLRSLLAHFSSALPVLEQKVFVIEVEDSSGLVTFKKGRQRVEFETVLAFADNLFGLLDVWALRKLQKISPDTSTQQIYSRGFVGPLKVRSTTARPFLRMARQFQRRVLESATDEQLKEILSGIKIQV